MISLHLYPVCIGSIWHFSSTPIIFCFIFHSIHNIVTSFLRRSRHSISLFLNIMLNLIFNLLFCYTFLRCFHDFSFKCTSFKFLFFTLSLVAFYYFLFLSWYSFIDFFPTSTTIKWSALSSFKNFHLCFFSYTCKWDIKIIYLYNSDISTI